MPMPQYNGPVYAQGPTAVGPYNLQGYQPTFGYNPQQTYMPQTPQPVPSQEPMAIPRLIGRSISANDQIPPKEIPSDGSPAYFPMQMTRDMSTMTPDEQLNHLKTDVETMWRDATPEQRKRIKESLTKWSTTLTV